MFSFIEIWKPTVAYLGDVAWWIYYHVFSWSHINIELNKWVFHISYMCLVRFKCERFLAKLQDEWDCLPKVDERGHLNPYWVIQLSKSPILFYSNSLSLQYLFKNLVLINYIIKLNNMLLPPSETHVSVILYTPPWS